jgi:hypothetical protein
MIKSLVRFDNIKSSIDHLKYQSADISVDQLPDITNEYFVIQHIPPLDHAQLPSLISSLGPLPDEFVLSECEVCKELLKIKLCKSVGPDAIPHKTLKDTHIPVLAAPVAAIINASIRQSVVPGFWKVSRVTVLFKVFPTIKTDSYIRPTSVTNSLSKVAKRFISRMFNKNFDHVTDTNQLGCVKNRRTTHALIKIMNHLFKAADSSSNFLGLFLLIFVRRLI